MPPSRATTAASASRSRASAPRRLALGDRPYVDDMTRPGMLHGALVLSPHAARPRAAHRHHARRARCPACVRVATAADVPGERWYGLLYNDWPGFVAEGEEVRCVGDVLAAVAAVDEATARAAAALVEVELRGAGAGARSAARARAGAPRVNPQHANLLSSVDRRGAATPTRRSPASAHVVSGTWKTQRIEHLFLEPESALAEPLPDGTLAPLLAGPGHLRRPPAGGALPRHRRRRIYVELVPNGGAFGGKEDMSVQAQTALLAQLTARR